MARPGFFCREIIFLCRDRVSNGREALFHDRIGCVTTECGQMERFCVATELTKARRNYVATEQFYVAIELTRVERIYITIEDFYVPTEVATTESSVAHDRAGRVKAGAHDSVASCRVATWYSRVVTELARQGLSTHATRPGRSATTLWART